jgi:hypothetical protein
MTSTKPKAQKANAKSSTDTAKKTTQKKTSKKTTAKKPSTKKKSSKSAAKAKPTPEAKKRAKKAAKTAHESNRNPLRADQMSGELVEFITAIDSYKRIHERPFPSWSEILVIVKALGYERAG